MIRVHQPCLGGARLPRERFGASWAPPPTEENKVIEHVY